MSSVPESRVRSVNDAPLRADGDWVVYWMTAFRRRHGNFALQRAVEHAQALGKPLVILEALAVDYRWASDRLHRFVLEGMLDNRTAFGRAPVTYYPYVEPRAGAGKGLLRSLAERACVVVGDDFPSFVLPAMAAAAAKQVPCAMELVDSNGLLPMRVADRVFNRAFDFRRFLQRALPTHLAESPEDDPLAGARLPRLEELPRPIADRWPAFTAGAGELAEVVAGLPIDHDVTAVADLPGGASAARRRLEAFVADGLDGYEDRNQPDQEVTSGLSPYLHFGHIGAHQVFAAVAEAGNYRPRSEPRRTDGKRQGFWGMSPAIEGFLDQLVTWRELGFNMCWQRDDYDRYESLPDWARATLDEAAADPRPHCYDVDELEAADTHDPIWNAAQTQLRRDGMIHNYLRMLWGKKILEWSPDPSRAVEVLIHLNNKFAVDGRNPNSYSGIFWCLGRYDRPWAPKRPIYGVVRYMSSENTQRKLRLRAYLERYAPVSRSETS